MTEDVLLAAHGLTHSYGQHTALAGVDITLKRGERLGFLGLNGAGKSTTMQILSGALAAERGTVEIGGRLLTPGAGAVHTRLGYLPQNPPLYDDMTVNESLAMHTALHQLEPSQRHPAIAAARERCGLAEHGARLIRHLSGGYRQRLGLAHALIHQPEVLILDEPTTGLDPAQIREVHTLLREFEQQAAMIFSTHILAEVQALATRVIILHHGQLVFDGPVGVGSGVLKTRFTNNPTAAELLSLKGVEDAEYVEDQFWLLHGHHHDPVALTEHAVKHGWGMLELISDYDQLEQQFLRLTAGAAPLSVTR